jgi:hypothetical protein
MNTRFYITLTLKTHKGLETFANFFIGNNRERAYDIFRQLKGTDNITGKNVLYIDFIETSEGLPVNIDMISCTLNQLADNCKLITKELFKLTNFDFPG